MAHKRNLWLAAGVFAIGLAANIAPVLAGQWYFYVKNNSSSSIKAILVSQDGSNWGYFDIGSGIGSGGSAKLIWDQSTNNQSCDQYIKATFSDGSESVPAAFNFCQDLDTPIVFSN